MLVQRHLLAPLIASYDLRNILLYFILAARSAEQRCGCGKLSKPKLDELVSQATIRMCTFKNMKHIFSCEIQNKAYLQRKIT